MWRRRRRWRPRRRRFKRRFYNRRRFQRRYRGKRQVRHLNVGEWVPARHRYVTVRGWEPLGNVCKNESCKTRAEPYAPIENGNTGSFHGTWGYHYLTLNTLQKRAKAFWNSWSDDWASYDYVKFLGMTVLIPPDQFHSWMIGFDPYYQTKEGLPLLDKPNAEETWFHPGILINNPKTHLILPQNYCHKRKFYKLKVKPPPGWKGYERLPEAMNYILCHWFWTLFNLNQPFFDVCNCNAPNPRPDVCMADPWWVSNGNFDKWINREKYDSCLDKNLNKNKTWGPFLQARNCSEFAFSAYFLYRMHFKFSGNSIWRPLPHIFANEGLVPQAPGPNTSKTRKHLKRRPQDTADILPGDLDSDGILKTPALVRITEPDHHVKRRRLEDQRRIKHLSGQLYNILTKYNIL
nr:ORF1 [Torque teno felis virus]